MHIKIPLGCLNWRKTPNKLWKEMHREHFQLTITICHLHRTIHLISYSLSRQTLYRSVNNLYSAIIIAIMYRKCMFTDHWTPVYIDIILCIFLFFMYTEYTKYTIKERKVCHDSWKMFPFRFIRFVQNTFPNDWFRYHFLS